jgi:hypothetical protein
MLPVCGMQNTDARFAGCGRPSVRSPAGAPDSLMHCAAILPKAPLVRWARGLGGDGQKLPVVPVSVEVPVLSGLRLTAMGAVNTDADGGQSWLVRKVLVPAEHAPPAFAP